MGSFAISFTFDYDPYGKLMRSYTTTSEGEKYLTTQHERDAETGLDYRGARFYDAEVGRFLSVDPLAIKYPSLNAFSYVGGMVSMAVDPDGKKIILANEQSKQFYLQAIEKHFGKEIANQFEAVRVPGNRTNERKFIKKITKEINKMSLESDDMTELLNDSRNLFRSIKSSKNIYVDVLTDRLNRDDKDGTDRYGCDVDGPVNNTEPYNYGGKAFDISAYDPSKKINIMDSQDTDESLVICRSKYCTLNKIFSGDIVKAINTANNAE